MASGVEIEDGATTMGEEEMLGSEILKTISGVVEMCTTGLMMEDWGSEATTTEGDSTIRSSLESSKTSPRAFSLAGFVLGK